jgi:hypothetical protein
MDDQGKSSAPSTISMSLMLLVTACSVTKPVSPAPTPASIQEYLARYPHATLRIADSTGRTQWIYDANLRGDTLRGLRSATMPRDSIAMPLRQVSEVAAPRFSATRTFGLVGALAALVGLYALLLPDPVY